MHNIYIDIETIQGPAMPSIDELMEKANYDKSQIADIVSTRSLA